MRNVLDYKCDQEHAIYRSSMSVNFRTFGRTAFKPIANHTKFRKPLLHRALSNGLESTPKA